MTITRSRWGAWLLIASLAAFVLVPVTYASIFSAKDIGLFADITPEQMAQLGSLWPLAVLTVLLAITVGNVGLILVSSTFTVKPWAMLATGVATLALALAVTDSAVRIAVVGFTEARLGDTPHWAVAEVLSNAGFAASALGIVLLSFTMFASGRHRTAGLVIGVLGAVVFLVSLVAYAFVPPFLLALLWLPLGIVVLRGVRQSKVAG